MELEDLLDVLLDALFHQGRFSYGQRSIDTRLPMYGPHVLMACPRHKQRTSSPQGQHEGSGTDREFECEMDCRYVDGGGTLRRASSLPLQQYLALPD